ncbi:MAG: PIN domain-containing protein [Actinophytocola sp.]|nr:PIN domain-containing protein [Actinophytocola sp.]
MILADSGVFIAAANTKDRHHQSCASFVRENRGSILVSPLVIAEVCFMIGKMRGVEAKAAFLDAFPAGVLTLATLVPADTRRMAQLMRKYSKLDLDAADTSIVALAERLRLDMVASIDRRDFAVIRPEHVDAFTLVPGL